MQNIRSLKLFRMLHVCNEFQNVLAYSCSEKPQSERDLHRFLRPSVRPSLFKNVMFLACNASRNATCTLPLGRCVIQGLEMAEPIAPLWPRLNDPQSMALGLAKAPIHSLLDHIICPHLACRSRSEFGHTYALHTPN